MAQKKYRPGMNCEKTGKYTCYDKDGNEMYGDVDVEKGETFSSFIRKKDATTKNSSICSAL